MALDYLLGGVIAFSVLVAVHEFGHYSVARLCGVRVLAFSIGFGGVLWQRTDTDGTRWCISALPLGGYVKLLNRHTMDELPAEQRQAAYAHSMEGKGYWQKISIILAGPLINLIFAALLFACLHVSGTYQLRPVIGSVAANSPAARIGIAHQDTIIALNGQAISSWNDVESFLQSVTQDTSVLTFTLRNDNGIAERTLFLDDAWRKQKTVKAATLGIMPHVPPLSRTIAQVVPDSPATAARFRSNDEIIAIAGEPMADWQQIAHTIAKATNEKITITVLRNNKQQALHPTIGARQSGTESANQMRGYLGVVPAPAPHNQADYFINVQQNPWYALYLGTVDMLMITMRIVNSIWDMITGQAGLDGLGGPVTIVAFAGESFQSGIFQFMQFMALLSMSLGVFNLLPLPLLDGGHIVLYTLETLRGKQLSPHAEQMFFRMGVACIFALVAVASFNDIVRFFI